MAPTSHVLAGPSTRQFKPAGSRYVGIGLVIIIHIAAVYALYVSLNQRSLTVVHGPIQVSKIEEEKAKETPPPPPPPPDFKPPPPYVPPPDINIAAPAPTNTTAITTTNVKPVVAPPPPPPAPAAPKVVVNARLDPADRTEPQYPAISKRLGEEGLVIVIVDVSPQGTAIDATIEKSSGFPRLDAAALELAKRKRFIPGTEDGKPVASKCRYQYRFVLQ